MNPAPPDEVGALYMVRISRSRELFVIPMSGANLQGEQVPTRAGASGAGWEREDAQRRSPVRGFS